MARDRKTIKKELTDAFISDPNVIAKYGLDTALDFEQQFSLVSVENLWFDAVSFGIYNHELIVSKNAQNSRPHTIQWYRDQAMSFLDGLSLQWIDGQFKYDLTGVLDAELRKIIKRCAVLESNDGQLVIKVATDNSGNIEPISNAQLIRFSAYMNLIKDAGNSLVFVNEEADNLKVTLTVQVDALIIDLTTGQLLSSTAASFPVKDAINSYLANLEFNGAFVRTFFIDSIQQAVGVKNLNIDSLQWKYASFSFVDIGNRKVPEAGYFKIDDVDLTINYIANELD
jgi:hypothetical protein